jgi:hypothetical protein
MENRGEGLEARGRAALSAPRQALLENPGFSPCGIASSRQLHGHEIIFGVQVAFAGLVDHAKLMKSECCFVGDGLINLAQFQRSWVALVGDADNELGFPFRLVVPASFNDALDREFFRPNGGTANGRPPIFCSAPKNLAERCSLAAEGGCLPPSKTWAGRSVAPHNQI